MKYSARIAAAGTFLCFLSAGPAQAADHRIEISAYVPTRCSAELQPAVRHLGEGRYSLGQIRQFCNTGYQLTLFHGSPNAPLMLSYKGTTVQVGASSTLLEPAARPTNGTAEVILYGADEAQAQAFASMMAIGVTPLGL